MKMLLLSDLHNRVDWFEWITAQASHYDVVAVGGDLLDGFDPGGLVPQMEFIRDWAKKVTAEGARLALVSGNHDGNDIVQASRQGLFAKYHDTNERNRFAAFTKTERWMDALAQPGNVAVDGSTDILGGKKW